MHRSQQVVHFPKKAGSATVMRSQDLHQSNETPPEIGVVSKMALFLRKDTETHTDEDIHRKCTNSKLYKNASREVGAGNGLFCRATLSPHECLGVYTGRQGGGSSGRYVVAAAPSESRRKERVYIKADPKADILAIINEPTAGAQVALQAPDPDPITAPPNPSHYHLH